MKKAIRVRKKPVVVSAIQWTGENKDAVQEFVGRDAEYTSAGMLFIHTLEGCMIAGVGDWIIRGVSGEFYPCKPDIFDRTYEVVDSIWKRRVV